MTVLSRLFWQKFHRSDRSAAIRWCAFLFFVFASFPVLGSVTSFVVSGGIIVAYAYILFGIMKYINIDRHEILISITFLTYFFVQLSFALLHENTMAGLSGAFSSSAFLFVLPLFPVLRSSVQPSWEVWFFRGIASGSALAGLVAIWATVSLGTLRVEALTGNPLVFAYLAGVQSLLSGRLFFHVGGRERWFFGLAAILGAVAVVLSGSRAPLFELALLAVAGLVWALLVKGFAGWRHALLALYVALVAVVGLYQFTWNSAAVMTAEARLQVLFEAADSADSTETADEDFGISRRLTMYKAGWEGFLKHPFAGYGIQNVMSVVSAYAPGEDFHYNHLHNAYLTDAVASGILGLLSFLAVSFTPLMCTFRDKSILKEVSIIFVVYNLLYHITNIGFAHDIKSLYFCMFVVTVSALAQSARLPSRATLLSYADFVETELAQAVPGDDINARRELCP